MLLHLYERKNQYLLYESKKPKALHTTNSTIEWRENTELDILCNTEYIIMGVAEIIYYVRAHKLGIWFIQGMYGFPTDGRSPISVEIHFKRDQLIMMY